MNISWKSLVWSAAAALLLSSLATPLNFLTVFLIMPAFIVLFSMFDVKRFALHLIPIGVVAYFLSGSWGPAIVTLAFFFLVPSIAMGHLYKKGSSAKSAVTAGFVIILAQVLLELLLFSALYNIDLKAELTAQLANNLKQFETTSDLFPAGWAVDTARAFGDAVMMLLPTLIMLFAFLLTVTAHGFSRLALRKIGIDAPALPQAKTWRVSRSLVLIFIIALIASYAMSEDRGGYWWIAVINLVPILEIAFLVQAIGFVFFLADAKKWPRAVSLLLCIPLLLFYPRTFLIGLLDAAFPLRKYFVK
ncbi:DUF2232 domain-containing protein [Cohnella terricola]|uniref:DUF2232 domain-containing protein n=1 Tax=Cohnella terricola TaxID=1289167 RepID=UPI0016494477|nr:DUF2232 domain-containing protein [Cohnella terricola]